MILYVELTIRGPLQLIVPSETVRDNGIFINANDNNQESSKPVNNENRCDKIRRKTEKNAQLFRKPYDY